MNSNAVDYALVNNETHDVLRTDPRSAPLWAIAHHMNETIGHSRFEVYPMRREAMGEALYKRAVDCRYAQAERAKSIAVMRRERILREQGMSEMRL